MTDITPERLALVWLDDANYDLAEANKLFEAESYPWCCFIASTSAEKSLKALIYRFNAQMSPARFRYDRSKAEEALEAAEQILEASKRIFQKASEILKSI